MSRILIAEDDATTRKFVGFLVSNLGHVPIYSPDGQHALETLQADDDIDLLVTDVMMPRLDGRGLIMAIRNTPKLQNLPIVVMSAVVGPREIHDLLKMGATRFQVKPLDRNMLEENIQTSLEYEKGK